MSSVKTYERVKTPEYMPSIYGITPKMRAYDLPGIVSVNVRELFPEIPEPIYTKDGDDISTFEKATKEALKHVDMSMIHPDDSVNICCAEHGFSLFGGKPYIRMLEIIKKTTFERTGCRDIRLRLVMYRTPREGQEVEEYYNLRELFDNKVECVSAFDKAVPIQTRIGTLYGLERAYDADKFIFAYYDDPREIYFHRMYRKCFKAFTMNMARYETRSAYHCNMGFSAAANIIPTAIFDSDFVQSKYAFSCFMRSAPSGLVGVDADNDLYAIDARAMTEELKTYTLPYHLYRSLEAFTGIVDGGRWLFYMPSGGVISGAVMYNDCDWFDLDAPPETQTWKTSNMKVQLLNQSWYGLAAVTGFACTKTIIVGQEHAKMYYADPTNKASRFLTKTADTLPEGVEMAKAITGNDKLLLFDGSFKYINCSESLAEEMAEKAPAVRDRVLGELYPKYMKQRGLTIPA